MFDTFNDGQCPQCMLNDEKITMALNNSDFWECPKCRLQAHTGSYGMMALLRTRGSGQLRETLASEYINGFVLTKAGNPDYRSADSSGFRTEQELRMFLDEVGAAEGDS